jgi:hypothetical protein
MTRIHSLLLAALALAPLACATPCEKVQASHLAFRKTILPIEPGTRLAPDASDGAAHLSVSVPYELIDAMIAKELARVPKAKLPLGSVAGVSLGTVQVGVEGVRARKAPPGQLGFRISIGLREGKRTILTVDVDARLRPRLDARAGTLEVALAGSDVIALDPSISTQSRKQLGEWIWSQLPDAAKMLVDRNTVSGFAGDLAEQLTEQAANLLEREFLDELGELARFEFDLPEEVPIQSIELAAGDRYLDIDLRTPLRIPHGVAPGHARVEGLHPNLVQVRLSGDAVAALANHAIREGRIPSRWTLEGEPDPEGEIWAGVGWAEGTPDPLEIHLWKVDKDCAHVVLRGEPHLRVDGQELELGTEKAKVESVVGSAKVKAGLFFSKTARRGVELIERTAAATEVEIGQSAMTASIAAAQVQGDEVVLGLALRPQRSR